MNNEKGYTLLTVILMMVLMTTFGLVLASAALNTAKQNNITEEEAQVTDLAEMGVTYFETEFRLKLKTRLKELEEYYEQLKEEAASKGEDITIPPIDLVHESNEVIRTIQKNHFVDWTEDSSFNFKFAVDSVTSPAGESSTKAVIAYTSTGCIGECSNPEKDYSITGDIIVTKNPQSGPVYPKPDEITPDLLPDGVKDNKCEFKNDQLTTGDCFIEVDDGKVWTSDIHMNDNQTVHIIGNMDVDRIKFSSGAIVCVYGNLSVDDIYGNPDNRFLYALSTNSGNTVDIETDQEKVYKACLPHLDFSDDNPDDDWDISLNDPVYH